jgi:hypothetical protein
MKLMANLDLVAPGKLLVLALTVIGCFAYIVASLFVDSVDTTPAWALMTLIVGYLIGNGTGASRGVSQAPVFQPTLERAAARIVTDTAEAAAAKVKEVAAEAAKHVDN